MEAADESAVWQVEATALEGPACRWGPPRRRGRLWGRCRRGRGQCWHGAELPLWAICCPNWMRVLTVLP